MTPLLIQIITATLLTLAALLIYGILCYVKGRRDQKLDDQLESELLRKPWHNNKPKLEEGWEFKAKELERKEAA